jgi:ATP-dependent Clp protease ATP-binding subunit ClpC
MKLKKPTRTFTIYFCRDDGQLTDGLGRKIDFKNSLIIMTSNIGARQLKDFGEGVGFATASRVQNAEENNKAVIEKALKRTFSPEFLNRIDDVVVFNSLERSHIFQIIDILMDTTSNLAQGLCTAPSRNTWKTRWQKKY